MKNNIEIMITKLSPRTLQNKTISKFTYWSKIYMKNPQYSMKNSKLNQVKVTERISFDYDI